MQIISSLVGYALWDFNQCASSVFCLFRQAVMLLLFHAVRPYRGVNFMYRNYLICALLLFCRKTRLKPFEQSHTVVLFKGVLLIFQTCYYYSYFIVQFYKTITAHCCLLLLYKPFLYSSSSSTTMSRLMLSGQCTN